MKSLRCLEDLLIVVPLTKEVWWFLYETWYVSFLMFLQQLLFPWKWNEILEEREERETGTIRNDVCDNKYNSLFAIKPEAEKIHNVALELETDITTKEEWRQDTVLCNFLINWTYRFNFWQMARTIWLDAYCLSYFSEGTDPAVCVRACSVKYM